MIVQTAQEAAAIAEEWRRRFDKYLRLTEELERMIDRKIMCLERSIAAHRRMMEQDPTSRLWQLIDALLWGDPWPGGDVRQWEHQEKRAELHAQSIEKEREALGDPTFAELKRDLAGLQTWLGPLPSGSCVRIQDGRELPLHWVFIEHSERIFFLADDGGSSLLLRADEYPFSSALIRWREEEK